MTESIFTRLCDLTDELQRLTRDVHPDGVRYQLEALCNRLDLVIDDTVGLAVPELTHDEEEDHAQTQEGLAPGGA